MKSYDRYKPLISSHIPKTGGTSFRNNLMAWFGRNLHFHYKDESKNGMPGKVRLRSWWGAGFRRDLCIHGHFNRRVGLGIEEYYPEVDQFITWVRDPVDAQISMFFHEVRSLGGARYREGEAMHVTGDIDEFFEKSRCPFLLYFPRAIIAENLEAEISRWFVHVGVLECADTSLRIMAEKLGKHGQATHRENVSARSRKPSESSIRKFKETCALEYRLFELAMRMNS